MDALLWLRSGIRRQKVNREIRLGAEIRIEEEVLIRMSRLQAQGIIGDETSEHNYRLVQEELAPRNLVAPNKSKISLTSHQAPDHRALFP